jgi:glutathione S-transferase
VRPALEWLAQVWPRIDGGHPPPLTAEVWLLAVSTAWQPQGRALTQLWRTLRVALLAAAWQLRTRREAAGEQFTTADVCAAFFLQTGDYTGVARCRAPACNLYDNR